MTLQKENKISPIAFSCYVTRSRGGEQFIPDHVFSYQVSGSMVMNDGSEEFVFNEGDFRFAKRNHLVKFLKLPPEGGEFRSLSVHLSQETLRNFSMEFGYRSENHSNGDAVLKLNSNALYKSYMDSLLPYLQLDQPGNESLLSTKLKEAMLLLLKVNPELKDVLFDFSEPGKIDLEAFMN